MARKQAFGDYARGLLKIIVIVAVVGAAIWAWHHGIPGMHAGAGGAAGSIEEAHEPAAPFESNLTITYPAPEFTGIEHWYNVPPNPPTIKDLLGSVVLINFWSYSSVQSMRALPYIAAWDQAYRDKGLVVVSIHSPQFEFEKKPENLEAAVQKYGIGYPVGADNDLGTWNAYENNFYPAQFLVDVKGTVVYRHYGRGGFDATENNIRSLLGLPKKDATTPDTPPPHGQTAQIFLGYNNGEHVAGKPDARRDTLIDYPDSPFMPEETWMVVGPWKKESQRVTSQEPNVLMRLHFNAQKVYLVMGTSFDHPARIVMHLNGVAPGADAGKDIDKNGALTLDGHRIYELIDQHTQKSGLLEILVRDPNVEMYSFSFE